MTAGSPGRVKRPLLWLMAAGLVLIVYGAAVEPYWIDEVHQVGVVPGLPGAWEGARVAVIGDLQVGMWRANVSTIRPRRATSWRPTITGRSATRCSSSSSCYCR